MAIWFEVVPVARRSPSWSVILSRVNAVPSRLPSFDLVMKLGGKNSLEIEDFVITCRNSSRHAAWDTWCFIEEAAGDRPLLIAPHTREFTVIHYTSRPFVFINNISTNS